MDAKEGTRAMAYVVLLAWGYVVLMMALAAVWAPDGGVWAALRVLLGYGVLPMALFISIAGSPLRRKAARHVQSQEAAAEPVSDPPDAGGHAATGAMPHAVAPVRKER